MRPPTTLLAHLPHYETFHAKNMSTILTFVLAMILYPSVQKKAQEELDRVVGSLRLPMMADMESMPYLRGAITEAMRWQPAIPLCEYCIRCSFFWKTDSD